MGSCCSRAGERKSPSTSSEKQPSGKQPFVDSAQDSNGSTIQPAAAGGNDSVVIQQYNQLYAKVRAFSAEFQSAAKSPPKASVPADVQQLVQRVVLVGEIPRMLADKTRHRDVIEGLVGTVISDLLTPSKSPPNTDLASLRKAADELCGTLLKFASSKRGARRLKADIVAILQLAASLDAAFKAQQGASFVVAYTHVSNRDTPVVFSSMMEDSNGSGGGGGPPRKVGAMVFPGLFKTARGTRTCLVKIRVVCTDDM